jgi:hypothetical protein
MKTLPRILKIVSIEPFKITTLWNTGEVRINDLSMLLTDPNSNLIVLHDATVFMQAAVSEERTLYWPNVMQSITLSTRTITAPLDLDPDTLYSQSTLLRKSDRRSGRKNTDRNYSQRSKAGGWVITDTNGSP